METEARYADDKRGDTKAISGEMALPVEAKRHYNKELWTAPTKQLIARYSRDPASGGRGLYVVFWFGIAPGRPVPKPPPSIALPLSASELEDALRRSLTDEQGRLIRFICIDVAWPAQKAQGAKLVRKTKAASLLRRRKKVPPSTKPKAKANSRSKLKSMTAARKKKVVKPRRQVNPRKTTRRR